MAINNPRLLSSATATGAGDSFNPSSAAMTFHAVGSVASSTGAAAVAIEVSNNGNDWNTLGTISLSLTTSNSADGFSVAAAWRFVRGNVTSISGTGAAVSLSMGCET